MNNKILKERGDRAERKISIPFNMSNNEVKRMIELGEKKDMSNEAVLRSALKLLSLVETKLDNGFEMVFRDIKTKRIEKKLGFWND